MKKRNILLFHIAYWAFYFSMLLFVFFAVRVGHSIPNHKMPYFLGVALSFVVLPSIMGFYTSYHLLFTVYIRQRKITTLFAYGVSLAIVIAAVCAGVITLAFGRDFMFRDGYTSFISEFIIIAIIALTNGLTGFILKGFISWYDDLKVKERLQHSTHLMELELVKSKLDPHFLFNTINNIDGLMINDAAAASKYLDKLSKILRFMLYESKEAMIPLRKELEYIQKYIDLQKIRTTNADFVHYEVEGDLDEHQIPAMLFIPFIENAFKHVVSKKKYHAIKINITVEKDNINFTCENNYDTNFQSESEGGGIGIELIKKRLHLLYPDRHVLELSPEEDLYRVQLRIMTNEN